MHSSINFISLFCTAGDRVYEGKRRSRRIRDKAHIGKNLSNMYKVHALHGNTGEKSNFSFDELCRSNSQNVVSFVWQILHNYTNKTFNNCSSLLSRTTRKANGNELLQLISYLHAYCTTPFSYKIIKTDHKFTKRMLSFIDFYKSKIINISVDTEGYWP